MMKSEFLVPALLGLVRDYETQKKAPKPVAVTTPGINTGNLMALQRLLAGQEATRADYELYQQNMRNRQTQDAFRNRIAIEDLAMRRANFEQRQKEAAQPRSQLYQVRVPDETGNTQVQWHSVGVDPETGKPVSYGALTGPTIPGTPEPVGPDRTYSPGSMYLDEQGSWSSVPYPTEAPPPWAAKAGKGGQGPMTVWEYQVWKRLYDNDPAGTIAQLKAAGMEEVAARLQLGEQNAGPTLGELEASGQLDDKQAESAPWWNPFSWAWLQGLLGSEAEAAPAEPKDTREGKPTYRYVNGKLVKVSG